jgi:eukaryotic-like serine/threonine-protein kinase
MESDRWRQIDRIFESALELAPERRAELLDRECAGDEGLRREVESLLAHDRIDGFLERGGAEEAARLLVEGSGRSLVGRRLGRFEVEARVGAGGMGEVYRARDPVLGRPVALKLIPAHLGADPERARRFRQEALAASALNHPNILTVHEILELPERDVLVTELVEGVTLEERLAAGPLAAAEALDIATQIARALAAAHAVGIVHRDVKPGNVMIREDGLVKLLDFGIAKSLAVAPEEDGTSPGQVIGTVASMSPEQARGLPVDARTDVWSLGVILYQLATGESPFRAGSSSDTLAAILTRDPPPPSALRPGLPAALDRVVARALAKDRDARYADGAALQAELERVRDGLRQARGRRPAAWRTAAAGGLLAAVVLAGGVWYARASAGSAIDSLAVLPLVNTGGDPGLDYLSDGIAESLIQSLAEAEGLRVASQTASFRYRGAGVESGAVAKELGVRGVLTGRMTPREDGLAVSLELIDGRDASHVWGARYEVETAELASLHETVARDLRRTLRRRSSRAQSERLERRGTRDARAYQLYLQGRFHWHRPLPADYHRSRDFFLRAIELDPDYALAWSGLANYYGRGAAQGMIAPEEAWPRAEQAGRRALALDPDLPEAQTVEASVLFYWRREWAEGERRLRRAVEVFPEANAHLSGILSLTGRVDEALELQRRAADYDPNEVRPSRQAAIFRFYSRRYEQAVEEARSTLQIDGTDVPSWEILGDSLHQLGRSGEAVAAWRQSLLLEGLPEVAAEIERALAESGPEAAMRALGRGRLAALEDRAARGEYVPAFQLARQALRAGDREAALDQAIRALEERNRLALDLLSDPLFDSIRDHPRFVEGVRRLGLPGAGDFAARARAGRVGSIAPDDPGREVDPEARRLFLRGNYFWSKETPEDYHRSLDAFRRASEIDPSYTEAWAGLARYYSYGASTGLLDPAQAWPLAEQAWERGAALDPDLPRLAPSLASITLFGKRDWETGDRQLRRAAELLPETLNVLAFYLHLLGRFDEAIAIRQRYFEVEPLSVRAHRSHGHALYLSGRFDEAAQQLRRALELDRNDVRSWELLGDALLELGRGEETVAAWRQALLIEGRPELALTLETTFERAGLDAAAAALARERLSLLEAARQRGAWVSAYPLARLHLRAGNRETALEWALRAIEERTRFPLDLRVDPAFASLRDDPRFQGALERAGLPPLAG